MSRLLPLSAAVFALSGCVASEGPAIHFSPADPAIGDEVTVRLSAEAGEVWFHTFGGSGRVGGAAGGGEVPIGTLTTQGLVVVRAAAAIDGEWRYLDPRFLGPDVTNETRANVSMPERIDLNRPLRIEVGVERTPNATVWLALSFVAKSGGAAGGKVQSLRSGDTVVAEVDLARMFETELGRLRSGDEFVLDVVLREGSSFTWAQRVVNVG